MKYRHELPQTVGKAVLADGGLETTMIFHNGFDLPFFAAFTLLDTAAGRNALIGYMNRFAELAIRHGVGFLMDTPTWRASARWASEIGVDEETLREIHHQAVEMLKQLRMASETAHSPFIINGVIGPQDDGYKPGNLLTAEQAEIYHRQQVRWFAEDGVDMVSAITMSYSDEAVGITRAALAAGIPIVVSFTTETDGRLPSGESLGEAIANVESATAAAPAYYMVNCAHPDHFASQLDPQKEWVRRIRGIRANASRCSHAQLDQLTELDEGSPEELARDYSHMMTKFPWMTIFGGCCGTDERHIDEIMKVYTTRRAT